MPVLEVASQASPLFRHKNLSVRRNRALRVMEVLRATEPSRIALGLRRVVKASLEILRDPMVAPEARAIEVKILHGSIDRFLDCISYPKRPVGTAGGKHTVDLRTLLDLTPAAPVPAKESTAGLPPDAIT